MAPESVLGLVVPFACYLVAEELYGSGVLAVVAAGLYLGHNSPKAGYATRLQEQSVWTMWTFCWSPWCSG